MFRGNTAGYVLMALLLLISGAVGCGGGNAGAGLGGGALAQFLAFRFGLTGQAQSGDVLTAFTVGPNCAVTQIGQGTVGTDGSVTVNFSQTVSANQPIEVRLTGPLTNLASGATFTVSAGSPLRSLIPFGQSTFTVTPITLFAASCACTVASTVTDPALFQQALVQEYNESLAKLAVEFGTTVAELQKPPTSDPSDTNGSRAHYLIIASLDQLAANRGVTPDALYATLAADFGGTDGSTPCEFDDPTFRPQVAAAAGQFSSGQRGQQQGFGSNSPEFQNFVQAVQVADLEIVSSSFSSTEIAIGGTPITVSINVTNTGTASASLTTATLAVQRGLTVTRLTNLPIPLSGAGTQGASTTVQFQISAPAQTATTGGTPVFAAVLGRENNTNREVGDGENIGTIQVRAQPAQANLVITQPTPDRTLRAGGDGAQVSSSISNTGGTTSSSFSTRVRISQGGTNATNNFTIIPASNNHNPLAPGAQTGTSFTISAGGNAQAGSYSVFIEAVDGQNNVLATSPAGSITVQTAVGALQVTVTGPANPVTAGTTTTIQAVVRNTGGTAVNLASVSISGPSTAIASFTPTSHSPNTSLAPSAQLTFTFQMSVVSTAQTQTVTVTVTANGTDAIDNSAVSDSDSVNVQIQRQPIAAQISLSAVETTTDATDVQLIVGNTLPFRVVVTNAGEVTASNVVVTPNSNPSAGVTFVPTSSTPQNAAAGDTNVSFAATFTQTGTFTIDASATSDNGGSDNSAAPNTLRVTVLPVPPGPGNAVLVISAADASSEVKAGATTGTATFSVTNTGNATATSVTLTPRSTPAGTVLFNPSLSQVASIAPGQTATFTFTISANPLTVTTTTATLDATVSGSSPSAPFTTSDDSVTPDDTAPQVTVRPADVNALSVGPVVASTDEAFVGDSLSFTVTVTNSGNTALTSVTVSFTSTPSAAISFGNTTVVTGNTLVLLPGESATFSATGTVTASAPQGNVTIDAVASANGGTVTGRSTAPDTITVRKSAIAILSATASATATRGQTFTVTVELQNTGNTPFNQVTVTVTDQVGSNFALASGNPGAAVPAGDVTTFSYTGTVPLTAALGQDDITVTAQGNTTGAGPTEIATATTSTTIVAPAGPTLSVSNFSTTPTTVSEGQQFALQFDVTNQGPGDVTVTSTAQLTYFANGSQLNGFITTASSLPITLTSGTTTTLQFNVTAGSLPGNTTATSTVSVNATIAGTTTNGNFSQSFTNIGTFGLTNAPIPSDVTISGGTSDTITAGTTGTISFNVSLTAGSSDVTIVASSVIFSSSGGNVTAQGAPGNPTSIAAGSTTTLTFIVSTNGATSANNYPYAVFLELRDASNNAAQSFTVSQANVGSVTVQRPIALTISPIVINGNSSCSADLATGETYDVTATVSNASGQASAQITTISVADIPGVTLTRLSTGTGTLTTGSTIAGGSSGTIRYTLEVLGSATGGAKTLSITVGFEDVNNSTDDSENATCAFDVLTEPNLTAGPPVLTNGNPAVDSQNIPITLQVCRNSQGDATVSNAVITSVALQFFDVSASNADVTTEFTQDSVSPATTVTTDACQTYSFVIDNNSPNSRAGHTIRAVPVVTATEAVTGDSLQVSEVSTTFTLLGAQPILRITAVRVAEETVSAGQTFNATVEVQNIGSVDANLTSTATLNFEPAMRPCDLYAGAFTQVPNTQPSSIAPNQTALFTFSVIVSPTTTVTGLTGIGATIPATDASLASRDVTTSVCSGDSFTVQNSATVAGNFAFTLRSPGGIDKTSLATDTSQHSSFASTTVDLVLSQDVSPLATATLTDFELAFSIGMTDVTTEYFVTGPTSVTLSGANPTTTVTFTVTALSNATKFEQVTLVANFVSEDANTNTTAAFSSSTDNWYVRSWASTVVGQASFEANGSGATTLNAPEHFLIDSSGRMLISDSGNNRVLMYTSTSASTPSTVFGQRDTTLVLANQGLTADDDRLSGPSGIAVTGTTLFVADTNNNRVLVFYNYPNATNNAGANAPPAGSVLFQPDFTTATANRGGASPSATGVFNPEGLAVFADTLVVADTGNNRVLVVTDVAAIQSIPDGVNTTADGVYGQPDFTSDSATLTATGLFAPVGVHVANDVLYVADTMHNRVMVFENYLSSALSAGTTADFVLGQPDFTSSTGGNTATTMEQPQGVWASGDKLFVGDNSGDRVLVFSLPVTANGEAADDLFGQENFDQGSSNNSPTERLPHTTNTRNNGTVSRFSADNPIGVFSSQTTTPTSFWFVDSDNNRILKVPLP